MAIGLGALWTIAGCGGVRVAVPVQPAISRDLAMVTPVQSPVSRELAMVTPVPPATTRDLPMATVVLRPILATPPPIETQPPRPSPGISRGEADRLLPPAPRDLKAAVTGQGVMLTWSPGAVPEGAMYPRAADHYRVYRGEVRDEYTLMAQPAGTQWLDREVQAGRAYWYTVVAVHGALPGRRPDPVEVRVER